MKTLYKFFKTAEVSQESPIYQKVKVEKYNLAKKLKKGYLLFNVTLNKNIIAKWKYNFFNIKLSKILSKYCNNSRQKCFMIKFITFCKKNLTIMILYFLT
jgi:hypothetical protein